MLHYVQTRMILTLFRWLTDDSGAPSAATSERRQAGGRWMADSADGEVGNCVTLQQRVNSRMRRSFRSNLGQKVAGVVDAKIRWAALPPSWTISSGYQITAVLPRDCEKIHKSELQLSHCIKYIGYWNQSASLLKEALVRAPCKPRY